MAQMKHRKLRPIMVSVVLLLSSGIIQASPIIIQDFNDQVEWDNTVSNSGSTLVATSISRAGGSSSYELGTGNGNFISDTANFSWIINGNNSFELTYDFLGNGNVETSVTPSGSPQSSVSTSPGNWFNRIFLSISAGPASLKFSGGDINGQGFSLFAPISPSGSWDGVSFLFPNNNTDNVDPFTLTGTIELSTEFPELISTQFKIEALLIQDTSITPEPIIIWPITKGGNGHRYEFHTRTDNLTWSEAKIEAEAMGGHLATITSQAENDFIQTIITDNPWIGGYQIEGSAEPDGGWAWVTGEKFEFTNWDSPEPNNNAHLPYTTDENYLQIYSNGFWNDISHDVSGFTELKNFVVEYPLPKLVKLAKNPKNRIIYVLLEPSTWEEAEATARLLGGHLATIRNQEEMDWIWHQWGGVDRNLWIGLYDDNEDNTSWQWASGEPVTFTKWGDGEPSLSNEVYAQMKSSIGGNWNDTGMNDIDTYGVVELKTNSVITEESSNAPPPEAEFQPQVYNPIVDDSEVYRFEIAVPESVKEISIQTSTNLVNWAHLMTMPVSTAPLIVKDLREIDSMRVYRIVDEANSGAMKFSWPLPKETGNPYTHTCSAIQDHSEKGDGKIIAYDGQVAEGALYDPTPDDGELPAILEYAHSDASKYFEFDLLNYNDLYAPNDKQYYLSYDGHRGYDYPQTRGKKILAAASGNLFLATEITDSEQSDFWRNDSIAEKFSNIIYSWDDYHTFYIIHSSGYSTWYLHADDLSDGVEEQIRTNGYAEVKRGDHIGYVGDKAPPTKPVGIHLHFAVRKTTGTTASGEYISELVDPYGIGDVTNSEVLWDIPPPENQE